MFNWYYPNSANFLLDEALQASWLPPRALQYTTIPHIFLEKVAKSDQVYHAQSAKSTVSTSPSGLNSDNQICLTEVSKSMYNLVSVALLKLLPYYEPSVLATPFMFSRPC